MNLSLGILEFLGINLEFLELNLEFLGKILEFLGTFCVYRLGILEFLSLVSSPDLIGGSHQPCVIPRPALCHPRA